jgi:hypothetical protein
MAFPKVYLFAAGADHRYWRYDIAQDKVEQGWPKNIRDEWRRWPKDDLIGDPFPAGGAFNAGNGKAYFFFGKQYHRFDMALDRMDVGPLSVTKYWPGVPDEFIDTPVRLDDGNVCFFHGTRCTRFSMRDNKALDGYPRRIVDDWPGMPDRHIDAAVNFGNGSIYFFVDRLYTRFDLTQKQRAQPFESTASQWHGMPDVRVAAAIEWSDSDLLAACVPVYDPSFWNDDRSVLVNNNCYNYGCNRALDGFSNPGRGSGHPAPRPYTEKGLDAGVRSDGLVRVDDPDNPSLPGCSHLVMMFRWKNGGDFHFYHRNTDGTWSHKVGHEPAKNVDEKGNRITDPRTANRGAYEIDCGTYRVDRGLLRLE